MIKDNQKYFNRMHVVVDALVIVISYLTAWVLKFRTTLFGHSVLTLPFAYYALVLVLIIPIYLVLYYACSLYTPKRVQGRRLEAANIFRANTIGLLVVILGLYMVRQQHVSRSMLVIFYVINCFLEIILRNVIRYVLRNIRRRGYNQKHILLVGYSRQRRNISTGSWPIRNGVTRSGAFWTTM